MAKKYTIQNDHGPLKLKKSKSLVGLKLNKKEKAEDKKYVSRNVDELGGFQLVELNKGNEDLDNKLDEVRQLEEVEVGTHVYFPDGSDKPAVPTGDISITFEEGTSPEEQQLALDEFALKFLERRSDTFVIAQVTEHSPNPVKAAVLLQQSLLVKQAEPDFDTILDSYAIEPSDHLFSHQWHLKNQGYVPDARVRLQAGADAKVADAWKKLGNYGSSQVTIAVIDNGFDLNHPELKSKVTRPFDIRANSRQISTRDQNYTHGTPCASVALASINRSGIVGVAPNARFMPLSGTSFSDYHTELMFDYCVNNGADIISCSWGSTDWAYQLSYRKKQAIKRAAERGRNGKGCIVLYAVGNDKKNHVNFYAAHPDVIAVAASTGTDHHADYSNKGPEVTICAPSSGDWPVLAARAWWDKGDAGFHGHERYYIDGINRGNHYKHFGGTSSATPLVAGICALMLSANPELTAREVKDILIQTADKIGNHWEYSNGHSSKYGYGRVNAGRAVEEALRRKARQPSSGGFSGSNSSGTVTPAPGVPSDGSLFEVSVNNQVRTGWGIQIGAFSNHSSVMSLVSRLEATYRQPVYVQASESGSRTIYKVIVGAFPNLNDARSLQRQLQQAGYTNAFPKNLRDV